MMRAIGSRVWSVVTSPISLLSVVIASTLAFIVYQTINIQERSQFNTATAAARSYAKALSSFTDYYLHDVVPKAKRAGIEFKASDEVTDTSLPLPYSLMLDLGEKSDLGIGQGKFRLHSDAPWPARKARRAVDPIDDGLLRELRESRQSEVFTFREKDGRRSLVYGTPIVMKDFCLSCHNAEPAIAKSDWRVGDVRGVQLIELSLPRPTFLSGLDAFGYLPGMIALAVFLVCTIAALLHRVRRAERARDSNRRTVEVLQNVGEGVVTVCRDGAIWSFNRSAESTFGRRAGEVIGQPASILFAGDEMDSFFEAAAGPQAANRSARECLGLRADGNEVPLSIIVNENPDPDSRHAYIVSVRDMTELKRMEAHLLNSEKLRTVGKIAGGIAHNFNNILAVVMGNASLLKRRIPEFDTSSHALLNSMQRASKRGAQLSSELLSFGREQNLRSEAIDVNGILRAMTVMFDAVLQNDQEVVVETAGKDWTIFVDRGKLTDALLNLASNARDAMPGPGRLTFRVETAHFQPAGLPMGDYVVISAEDTGRGIDPDVLENIFEPFFTTKEVDEGNGMGLSMVHGFVHQSGGCASAESLPGQGARVKLIFPRHVSAPEHANCEPEYEAMRRYA